MPGLVIFPLVFLFPARYDLALLKYGVFLAVMVMAAQFSFWERYLPRVYPTICAGPASFAANVGGRMLGTSAALLTTQLAGVMPGGASAQLALAAAGVAALVYVLGFCASFWLPEPDPAHYQIERRRVLI
ncbi:MAG: hypothetical protein U1F68_12870 [Gammaproteobacteria bacterium]